MRIFAIFIAGLVFIIGFRMVIMALRTALSGKVLVREGLRSRWKPAPDMNEAWKVAIRNAIMGILLIVLGFFLLT